MGENMKTLDVDEFLKEHGVVIKIKGKSYIVRDIPTGVQDEFKKDPPDFKKIIVMLLKLEDISILDDYGIVALSKIVNMIHENLLQRGASQENSPPIQSVN